MLFSTYIMYSQYLICLINVNKSDRLINLFPPIELYYSQYNILCSLTFSDVNRSGEIDHKDLELAIKVN